MKTIAIIGWYGTETIGDRAILAGLIRIFSQVFDNFEILLGSLYPHFSERCLIEDESFHHQIGGGKFNGFKLFDSFSKEQIKKSVTCSDLFVVGGGPLMDLEEMYILQYAFHYASKKHVKTAVLGCGWGPLRNQKYIRCAQNIIKDSSLTIFRDSDSCAEAKAACGIVNVTSAIDPAFFCADFYRVSHPATHSGKFIAVNLRDVICSNTTGFSTINAAFFTKFLEDVQEQTELPLLLVPQHTFFLGGDDREIFNEIEYAMNGKGITVVNDPPSLEQVMHLYSEAMYCIGMRFHSTVLQLVLSGHNMVLDYTDPDKGKTISMLRQLGLTTMMSDRYISLHNGSQTMKFDLTALERGIIVSTEVIADYMNHYIDAIKKLNI